MESFSHSSEVWGPSRKEGNQYGKMICSGINHNRHTQGYLKQSEGAIWQIFVLRVTNFECSMLTPTMAVLGCWWAKGITVVGTVPLHVPVAPVWSNRRCRSLHHQLCRWVAPVLELCYSVSNTLCHWLRSTARGWTWCHPQNAPKSSFRVVGHWQL
jgi:hypothetical protein